jgi:hypothetical protein
MDSFLAPTLDSDHHLDSEGRSDSEERLSSPLFLSMLETSMLLPRLQRHHRKL